MNTEFVVAVKDALKMPSVTQADRAVKYAELAELARNAVSEHFFVKPAALLDLIKGIAAFDKPHAVRIIEDLRFYLSGRPGDVLVKPALVELQRCFIWSHADVVGYAPAGDISSLYGETDVPQVVRDILSAAVTRHGSSPRQDNFFGKIGRDLAAIGIDAMQKEQPVAVTARKPGDLVLTNKGLVVVKKTKTPTLSREEQAERARVNAAKRIECKQNRAGSAARRKAEKVAAKKAAEEAKNKGKKK